MLVKRITHGGILAPITRDIFLSSKRLTNTLEAADFLKKHDINTPEMVFIAWELTKTGYRCESGVDYIPDSIDASDYFFENDCLTTENSEMTANNIGRFVRQLHQIDFLHPDLNLMNFLITNKSEIYLLDLDKASPPSKSLSESQKQKNLARLIRSVRKQGDNASNVSSVSNIETVVSNIINGYGEL